MVSTNTTYTFTVNGPRTLEARFSANTYTITLKTNPTGAGSPSASPNPANVGQTVTLSANPGSCYNFSSWSVSAGTLNGNTLTMPAQNVTATANYTIKTYTIAVNVTKTGNSPNTPGTVSGAGTYNCGSSATLVATPATGFSFAGWYEGTAQVSTSATYTFTVSGNRTLEARFSAIAYNITFVSSPTGAGSPSASPNPAYVGQTVTLTANPGTNYNFSNWSAPSGVTITNNSFVMPAQNVTITANYVPKSYTITLKANPTSGGTPSASPNPANVGQTVTLSANPGSCYNFSSWSVSAGTLNGNTLTMPAQNITATANYTIKTYTIAVNITKTGNSPNTPGTVTGAGTYNCGSSATLVATPATGFSFAGWYEGTAQVSTSATYTFTVSGNRTLEARFSAIAYNITFVSNPTGAGSPVATPQYAAVGETVTLTPNPSSNYNFSSWSAPAGITITNNSFIMPAQSVTITANYVPKSYTITLKSNPTGAGSPSASPNPATAGQTVTLSANPGSCYNFSSWTVPAGVTITNNQFVMPAQNITATANYTIKTYTIAVNITKTGNSPNTPGTVTGAGTYNCGNSATLVATPATGFSFAGWYEGTAQVSTSATYTFTVNGSRTLEARFSAIAYTITFVSNPASGGSPSASPNPANVGQTVTLSAHTKICYTFNNWLVSAGTLNGDILTMPAQNVTVTANYTLQKYTITITVNNLSDSPNTPGTITGAGLYDCGTTATLTVVPSSGFYFIGWYIGTTQVSTNTTYYYTIYNNRTIEARFGAYDYKVTVVANPTGAGSPVATPQYAAVGETVTLTPNPSSNYNFSSWSAPAGITITNNSFIMPAQSVTITANYVPKSYTITLKSNPTGAGSPSASPNPATAGQTVTLSANPGSCYNFSSWTVPAGVTITNNQFVMPAQNVTATANYTVKSYTISLSVNNSAYGTVSGGGSYNCGSSATVVATPATGYNFLGWYEGTTRVSTNATYTFTVNGNRTLQARFGISASSYTITIVYEAEVPPSGNIATVSKNPASPGESVTLTIDKSAISSCYLYGGWSSPDLGQINYNLSSTSYTFTMPAQNVTIYVNLPTNPNYICW